MNLKTLIAAAAISMTATVASAFSLEIDLGDVGVDAPTAPTLANGGINGLWRETGSGCTNVTCIGPANISPDGLLIEWGTDAGQTGSVRFDIETDPFAPEAVFSLTANSGGLTGSPVDVTRFRIGDLTGNTGNGFSDFDVLTVAGILNMGIVAELDEDGVTRVAIDWDASQLTQDTNFDLIIEPVPLPAGILLMGTALAGFGVMRRRKQRA